DVRLLFPGLSVSLYSLRVASVDSHRHSLDAIPVAILPLVNPGCTVSVWYEHPLSVDAVKGIQTMLAPHVGIPSGYDTGSFLVQPSQDGYLHILNEPHCNPGPTSIRLALTHLGLDMPTTTATKGSKKKETRHLPMAVAQTLGIAFEFGTRSSLLPRHLQEVRTPSCRVSGMCGSEETHGTARGGESDKERWWRDRSAITVLMSPMPEGIEGRERREGREGREAVSEGREGVESEGHRVGVDGVIDKVTSGYLPLPVLSVASSVYTQREAFTSQISIRVGVDMERAGYTSQGEELVLDIAAATGAAHAIIPTQCR
ncbi:hypothetical protein KIPB_008481, partial [Kipferlia bialata]